MWKNNMNWGTHTHTHTHIRTHTPCRCHSLSQDHMSALKSFLLNVPALSHSYSCGFNGCETSWLGKWDSVSWATLQAINHRQQLLQPSLLWLQTLTSWNNIFFGVASLDGSQLLASWWKEDKIYYRPCRIWIKPKPHRIEIVGSQNVSLLLLSLWISARSGVESIPWKINFHVWACILLSVVLESCVWN